MTDYRIARDRWDRPYVSTDGQPLQFAPGQKTPINGEPYTRISTLAGALEDKSGLIDWSAARAMIGLVKNESLYAQVAHLASAFPDPWAVPEGKKPLKELVKRAQDIGGSNNASGLGTAFHGLTELLDGTGQLPEYIPTQLRPWIEEYARVMADFESVLVEPFVVNDSLKTAGSPDRYLRHKPTGTVYCADLKSGTDEPSYPMKVTVQVAIASRAVQYDQATGNRTPIECDPNWGIMIHTPIRSATPRCDLYWLDLSKGYDLAELGVRVREAKKVPKLKRVGDAA